MARKQPTSFSAFNLKSDGGYSLDGTSNSSWRSGTRRRITENTVALANKRSRIQDSIPPPPLEQWSSPNIASSDEEEDWNDENIVDQTAAAAAPQPTQLYKPLPASSTIIQPSTSRITTNDSRPVEPRSIDDIWAKAEQKWMMAVTERKESILLRYPLRGLQICTATRDMYMHNVYSLLMSLDKTLCITSFDIPENRTNDLALMVSSIKTGLHTLHTFCETVKLDPHFVIPDNFVVEPVDTVDVPTLPTDEKMEMLKNDMKSSQDQCFEYCAALEEFIFILVHGVLTRTDKRSLEDLSTTYATINHVINDEHTNYLCNRINFNGFSKGKTGRNVGSEDVRRLQLNGTFLVSLEEMDSQRFNLQYTCWQ